MDVREVRVERLLGTRVRDSNGEALGRLEEMIVEIVDGEPVVTEFHVGPGAMIERVAGFVRQLPFLRWLPGARRAYRVSWQVMDLSNPSQPRTRVPKAAIANQDATAPPD